mgnify:CR=1 FL=1
MPDNLRISAPATAVEDVNRPDGAERSPLVHPAQPSKVTRPDGDGKGRDLDSFLLEEDSVFGRFIARLKETPTLDRTLGKVVTAALAEAPAAEGGEAAQAAAPLRDFAGQIALKQEDMLESLMFQQENATVFSGGLFGMLKELSARSGDPQLDLRIADFLKAFEGYFSAESTTKSIAQGLQKMQGEIPANYAKELKQLADKITVSPAGSNAGKNLEVLKKEIVPYLGRYVAKTNDYGKVREGISMLMHDISGLEAGTKKNLAAKYGDLSSYCRYNLKLTDGAMRLLDSFFAEAVKKNLNEAGDKFSDSLIKLISLGVKDGAEGVDKSVFRDMCTSLLLDNSVYMPFVHMYLPVDFQGKSMFAQLWVEKNKADEKTPAAAEKRTRLFLTFDIEELGYFEAEVRLLGKHAELSLNCPEKLRKYKGEITPEISGILDRNGLTPDGVKLEFGRRPEVGEKIIEMVNERKRIVNVSV